MNRWGPAMVSAIILITYCSHALGLGSAPWDESSTKLMEVCLTLVMGYWLGSSSGSARKTELTEAKP